MDLLPPELRHQILDQLCSPGDVLRFALLNHGYLAIGSSRLHGYQRAYLSIEETSPPWFEFLFNEQELVDEPGSVVEFLQFTIGLPPECRKWILKSYPRHPCTFRRRLLRGARSSYTTRDADVLLQCVRDVRDAEGMDELLKRWLADGDHAMETIKGLHPNVYISFLIEILMSMLEGDNVWAVHVVYRFSQAMKRPMM